MTAWVWWAIGFFMGAAAEQFLGARIRAAGRRAADWLLTRTRTKSPEPDAYGWACGVCPEHGIAESLSVMRQQFDGHMATAHGAVRRRETR